jgi:hypothetical protein
MDHRTITVYEGSLVIPTQIFQKKAGEFWVIEGFIIKKE